MIESSKTLVHLNGMKYGLVNILGTGKTFKSGTLYSILEECPNLKYRKKAFLKFPDSDKLFPSDFNVYSVDDLNDVEPDSILIIEDANRVYPSRSSKSTELQEYLGLISHKDVVIYTTIQNTSNTDLCLLGRDQDTVFIHKKMGYSNITFEREELRSSCNCANQIIESTPVGLAFNWRFISYVPRFCERLILNDSPEWYDDSIAKALRNYKIPSIEKAKNKGASQ